MGTKNLVLCRKEPTAHGTVKVDHYWTGDNKSQVITSVETPAVNIGGAKVSAAIGKDRLQETSPRNERDVVDVFVKKPLTENLSVQGRVRTSLGQHNPTSQVRLGLQGNIPLSAKDSLYAQVYAADKIMKGGDTRLSFGAFAGLSHKLSENSSIFVEGQVYRGHHVDRDDVGVNAGFKMTF